MVCCLVDDYVDGITRDRTRHGEVQPLEVLVERQREIIDVRLHTVLHGVVHKNIAEGQQRARAALRMVLAVLGMALHPRNEDVRQRHDVVDLGVPVLSMHAPFEIVSKTDVYMAYRAFFTFFDTKD